MPRKNRDYKAEYEQYHSRPEQRKARSERNKARRLMEKKGFVRKGDNMEIDHKIPISKGGTNDPSNLKVVHRKTNRRKYNKSGAK